MFSADVWVATDYGKTMATQYMFSPHFNYAGQPAPPHPGSNGVSSYGPKNGGFAFRKRFERVDWRKLASIDVEQISRTLDFNALQENIMNITFCNIESELDVRAVDPNFIKIFKLAQLTIEYLLYSQEYLAGLCTTLEEKTKKAEEGQEDIKKELEAVKKELAEVKRESHKRKKLLIAQQQLMHAGAGSYNKCPFCPKAFLNSSFLQSHISRRHGSGAGSAISSGVGSGSGDPIKMVSPDHGVGDGLANNPQFEAEFSQIKERLRATEAQLEEERRALASIRRKEDQIMPMVADRVEAATEQQSEMHKRELEEVKEVFMRELREVNEKYMASERALVELEQRHGVKRSYLGTMQDDVENEKEMLQQQRAEVAALREQLQKQMDDVEDRVQDTIDAQERRRHHHRTKQKTLKSRKSRDASHREMVMEDEVVPLSSRGQAESPARSPVHPVESESRQHGISMYPSDEEESFAMGSGTSSLRTPRPSTAASTLGFSGTGSLGLRTSQFLEQLRQNPTLGLMREQLAELLAEKVEKCGIPRGAPGITDQVLQNKLAMQETQRKAFEQKYPNFRELRQRAFKEASDLANRQMRQQMQSPRQPAPLPSRSPRSQQGTGSRQTPSSVGGRPVGAHTRATGHTPRSASAPSPRPRGRASPTTSKPQPQPRAGSPQKTPLSTGSTNEWTSTQWDSDEDLEDEDEISGVKPFSPAPSVRMIQSGPRPSPSPRGHGSPIVIQSRPLRNNDDDIDDILGSDGEDNPRAHTQPVRVQAPSSRLSASAPQVRGQNVGALARSIESQLQGRKQDKPFGGVDTMSSVGSKKNQAYLEDFDDESDWDNPEEAAQPAQRPATGKSGRGSTDLSTNTFGTSQWGSSSKGMKE
ncbi:hypothetical protein BaRGS_00025887 [Batillaria attramentaria]|uniref:C2H2-type domain-containing protein n=1 Tax=Batillaria attramentaria TaxID=370345 RepID=A0ABD0K6K2_9CAEN